METLVGVGYLTSIPGILKLLEILFCFIGLICVVTTGLGAKGTAFLVAAMIGLIWTGLLLIFYVLNIISKIVIPWFSVEMIFAAILAVYLIIISAILIATSYSVYIAAGVFGLLAAFTYIFDACHKYKNQ